jgi:hypothetical protein
VDADVEPVDMVFVPHGDGRSVLLVSCRGKRVRDGSVVVYEGEFFRRLGTIDGLVRPGRMAVDGSRAWVVEKGARRVTAIDVAEDGSVSLGPRHRAGRRPVDVTVSPGADKRLFVVNGRRSRITVLDAETGRRISRIRARGARAVAAWRED